MTSGGNAPGPAGDGAASTPRGGDAHPPPITPIRGGPHLRVLTSLLLSVLCLLTLGGAILLMLLWRQSRDSGLLTNRIDRTWDLLDAMQGIERWVAFAVVPVATAWIALAAVNVGRATGQRPNPLVAALSLPVALAGVWSVGRVVIGDSDEVLIQVVGVALQIAILALPLVFLERIAAAAEARHRALRATYMIAGAYLAQLQFLGGLSNIDPTDVQDRWGRFGAYLLVGALIQVSGTFSANEAARAIDVGIQHRYQLRSRLGERLFSPATPP